MVDPELHSSTAFGRCVRACCARVSSRSGEAAQPRSRGRGAAADQPHQAVVSLELAEDVGIIRGGIQQAEGGEMYAADLVEEQSPCAQEDQKQENDQPVHRLRPYDLTGSR